MLKQVNSLILGGRQLSEAGYCIPPCILAETSSHHSSRPHLQTFSSSTVAFVLWQGRVWVPHSPGDAASTQAVSSRVPFRPPLCHHQRYHCQPGWPCRQSAGCVPCNSDHCAKLGRMLIFGQNNCTEQCCAGGGCHRGIQGRFATSSDAMSNNKDMDRERSTLQLVRYSAQLPCQSTV